MIIMSRNATDAIVENVPGRIFAFDIRADGEGSQALVASHDGENVLAMGETWWVSRLQLREDEDSGDGDVVATVSYQEDFGHPFDAGREYRELEGTMPEEQIDPPPPKGTIERRRYDQQMDAAYRELMRPISPVEDSPAS